MLQDLILRVNRFASFADLVTSLGATKKSEWFPYLEPNPTSYSANLTREVFNFRLNVLRD